MVAPECPAAPAGAALREEVERAVLRRRSIRRYLPARVPHEEIEELLRLTGRAPSAWNLQPWRFVVVQDSDTKARLQGAANGQPQVGGAPAVLVLYSDMDDCLKRLPEVLPADKPTEAREKARRRILEHFESLGTQGRDQWGRAQANIALGYLLLIAETRGLATSPMLGFDAGEVSRLLTLPEDALVVALVALGYAAEPGSVSARLDVRELTRWA